MYTRVVEILKHLDPIDQTGRYCYPHNPYDNLDDTVVCFYHNLYVIETAIELMKYMRK